jgi:hypothetical protein
MTRHATAIEQTAASGLPRPSVAQLPNARFERKFVVRDRWMAETLAVVRRHPAGFGRAYPDRIVNSVYLDTPGLTDYLDHLHGASRRSKTRIRWYGPLEATVARPTLERKLKFGAVGGKQTWPLPPVSLDVARGRVSFVGGLDNAGLPEIVTASLKLREPVVLVRYRRQYFESSARRFRLTIDDHLSFVRVRASGAMVTAPQPSDAGIIIELKYAPELAEDAETVAARLTFRTGRFSKYLTGVEALAI